jgi:hypothetical protein
MALVSNFTHTLVLVCINLEFGPVVDGSSSSSKKECLDKTLNVTAFACDPFRDDVFITILFP